MSSKLSKRKQKALAFRGKKVNEKGDVDDKSELEKAIPLEEGGEEGVPVSWLGKDIIKGTSTKRKRQDKDDPNSEAESSTSKQKKNSKTAKQDNSLTSNKAANPPRKKQKPGSAGNAESPGKPPAAKRFIVFVGNLPHETPAKLTPILNAHFPTPPVALRIPTKKGTNAPQGFAFAEFDSSAALEKALRCHHTVINGRKINVELTAGGGGKSENRMGKIKGKNESLEEERRKRVEEEKKEKEKESKVDGIHPDRLKRLQGGK
jgi:nucleolar protein 6